MQQIFSRGAWAPSFVHGQAQAVDGHSDEADDGEMVNMCSGRAHKGVKLPVLVGDLQFS